MIKMLSKVMLVMIQLIDLLTMLDIKLVLKEKNHN